jgi:hypothetical protein
MRTVLCISPTCFDTLPHRLQGADTNIFLNPTAIKYVTIDLCCGINTHHTVTYSNLDQARIDVRTQNIITTYKFTIFNSFKKQTTLLPFQQIYTAFMCTILTKTFTIPHY